LCPSDASVTPFWRQSEHAPDGQVTIPRAPKRLLRQRLLRRPWWTGPGRLRSGSSRALLRSPMPSGKEAPMCRQNRTRQKRWCSRIARSSECVGMARSPEPRDDHSTSHILQEGHNRTRTRRRSRRRSRQNSSDVAPRTEASGTTHGLVPAGLESTGIPESRIGESHSPNQRCARAPSRKSRRRNSSDDAPQTEARGTTRGLVHSGPEKPIESPESGIEESHNPNQKTILKCPRAPWRGSAAASHPHGDCASGAMHFPSPSSPAT
jgi:hypothetical protein